MDDLQMITTLLTKPDPSTDVADRGRHQLQNAMRGPVRKRTVSWPVAGIGLTALAAVATAIVVAAGGMTAAPHGPPDATGLSGRQVLLAAATTAETRSTGSGTYWHVKTVQTVSLLSRQRRASSVELWTRRDGREYVGLKPGTVGMVHGAPVAFAAPGVRLTFEEIQKLPTDPAALKAKFVEAVDALKPRPVPAMKNSLVIDSLTNLLSQMPAPPKVRAAAFRAIASFPGVRSLGTVPGGTGLLIPSWGAEERMILDPATSLVRNWTYTTRGKAHMQGSTSTSVTAEWTNILPRVVPMPK